MRWHLAAELGVRQCGEWIWWANEDPMNPGLICAAKIMLDCELFQSLRRQTDRWWAYVRIADGSYPPPADCPGMPGRYCAEMG